MSLSSSQIKSIRQLHRKKNRVDAQQFIVEGEKMVQELIKSDWEIEAIYTLENYDLSTFNGKVFTVSEKDLERISTLKNPNKVLAVVNQKQWSKTDYEKVLVLDGINDPGNLGTIIRTADWFGFDAVFCSEQTVEVYNPKVIQSTMGSFYRIPVFYSNIENQLSELTDDGFEILVTHLQGNTNWKKPDAKFALVMGSESHGVSDAVLELASQTIKLASHGKAESLNVAVATSIFCYELAK